MRIPRGTGAFLFCGGWSGGIGGAVRGDEAEGFVHVLHGGVILQREEDGRILGGELQDPVNDGGVLHVSRGADSACPGEWCPRSADPGRRWPRSFRQRRSGPG